METTSEFIPESCSISRIHPTHQLTAQLGQSCPPARHRALAFRSLAVVRTRWNDVEDRCGRHARTRGEAGGREADAAAAVRIGDSTMSSGPRSIHAIVVGTVVSAVAETMATSRTVYRKQRSSNAAATL